MVAAVVVVVVVAVVVAVVVVAVVLAVDVVVAVVVDVALGVAYIDLAHFALSKLYKQSLGVDEDCRVEKMSCHRSYIRIFLLHGVDDGDTSYAKIDLLEEADNGKRHWCNS